MEIPTQSDQHPPHVAAHLAPRERHPNFEFNRPDLNRMSLWHTQNEERYWLDLEASGGCRAAVADQNIQVNKEMKMNSGTRNTMGN